MAYTALGRCASSGAVHAINSSSLFNSNLQQLKMGRPVQKKVALELFKKANILPGPCGLHEISKFQGSYLVIRLLLMIFMHVMLVFVRALGEIKRLCCIKMATILM